MLKTNDDRLCKLCMQKKTVVIDSKLGHYNHFYKTKLLVTVNLSKFS